jgi:hypothetical protein
LNPSARKRILFSHHVTAVTEVSHFNRIMCCNMG